MKNRIKSVMISAILVISAIAACTQHHHAGDEAETQSEPLPNSNPSADSAGIYGELLDSVMSSADHTAPGM